MDRKSLYTAISDAFAQLAALENAATPAPTPVPAPVPVPVPVPVPAPTPVPVPPPVPVPTPVPVPVPAPSTGAPKLPANTNMIAPVYGTVPKDGETRTIAATGLQVTRMGAGLVVYSRYSPFNCDNSLLVIHNENSTSARIVNAATGALVRDLPTIGEQNMGVNTGGEIRWDATDPDKFYYVQNMEFRSYRVSTGVSTLIRSFAKDFPDGSYIANDVEGDCSLDSRYWCWQVMKIVQQGSYPTLAIFTYDKQSDAILGVMTPKSEGISALVRPNMVEITPDGKWAMIHWNRAYAGWNDQEIGTHRNGPHIYPLSLDPKQARWVCPDATHSGYAKGDDGWYLVSQNNRTDNLEAILLGKTYKEDGSNQIILAKQGDFDKDWGMGWHIAKSPYPYALISTYSKTNNDWADNQIYMYPLQAGATPIRLCPSFSAYPGNDGYRNESPAALSRDGTLMAWSNNWGQGSGQRAVYTAKIPF